MMMDVSTLLRQDSHDLDGDGILGEGDPDVDDNGQVITDDEDGYEDPIDADGNGILDCYYDAVILVVNIDSQPQYAGDIFQGENVSYSVGVTVDGNLPPEYQWQIGIVVLQMTEQDTPGPILRRVHNLMV